MKALMKYAVLARVTLLMGVLVVTVGNTTIGAEHEQYKRQWKFKLESILQYPLLPERFHKALLDVSTFCFILLLYQVYYRVKMQLFCQNVSILRLGFTRQICGTLV
jgi:hypothetical protein